MGALLHSKIKMLVTCPLLHSMLGNPVNSANSLFFVIDINRVEAGS